MTIRFLFLVCLPGMILFCSFLKEKEGIKFTQSRTIEADHIEIQTFALALKDTMAGDSLFLVRTIENIPVHYFRGIRTGVCFDNKCRELDIIIYWNITGRYLGFEMPEGEFLSKREHEPFLEEDYARLNELLADYSLPFSSLSFIQLLEDTKTETTAVDGVSGATSREISEMVIKGAAYTTYKLWNIVYGPVQDFIMHQTELLLTPDLIDLILKSPDLSDRVWALNRIDQSIELNDRLTSTLLDIISGDDYYLAYSAISALDPVHLDSDAFQSELFSLYVKAGHSLKKNDH